MTLWFLRGLRRGVVTTGYPIRPEPSAAGLPSPPAFRADQLDQVMADRLIDCCPTGALRRDQNTLVYDVGRCAACGRCLAVGEGAVHPSDVVELATRQRGDLVKRIPLRGGERT